MIWYPGWDSETEEGYTVKNQGNLNKVWTSANDNGQILVHSLGQMDPSNIGNGESRRGEHGNSTF